MMWGYGFGWFGWVFMVGFWALVVVATVWVIRSVADGRDASGASAARRILDERFASGDLSMAEYEERRRALR